MNATLTKPSQEILDIAIEISQFYLEKNNFDFLAAQKEVERLDIRELQLNNEVLTIYSSRPGLLIGVRGENFEKLKVHLGLKIEVKECFSWNGYLVPFDWSDGY